MSLGGGGNLECSRLIWGISKWPLLPKEDVFYDLSRAGTEARPDDFTALKEIGTSLQQRKSSLGSKLPCSAFNS